MPFGIGDSLKVRVSAATSDFTRGMESASESLNDVRNAAVTASGSLQILQGRANETGDEFDRLDRKTDATARGFDRLSVSAMGLSGSLVGLGAITLVSVIPSLVTLATIIAPLIATFGGIATVLGSVVAAFGLLIGTGFVTHWEEIQTEMGKAREEIEQIIQPLGEVFGPLIVRAIDRLPELVEAIVRSIGGVNEFRDALIQLGRFAMEVIPLMTEVMFDLARDAIPVLLDGLDWLRENGGAIFRGMMDTTREMIPVLVGLGESFADIIPELLTFGTAVSKTVIPVLGDLLELFGENLQRLNALPEPLRTLAISALILAPALALLTGLLPTLVGGFASLAGTIIGLSAPIFTVVAAIGVFAAAYATNFANIQATTNEVIGGVISWFADLQRTVSGVIRWLNRTLRANSRSFMEFESAVNRALIGVADYLNRFAGIFQFVFNKVLLPIVLRAAKAFETELGPTLSEVAQTVNALSGYAKVLGDVMLAVWAAVDQDVVPIIDSVVTVLGALVSMVVTNVLSSVRLLANLLQGDFAAAWKNVNNVIQTTFGFFETMASTFVGGLIDAVTAAATYLKEAGINTLTTAINWFGGQVGTVLGVAIDFVGVMKDAVDSIAKYLGGTGRNSAIGDLAGAAIHLGEALGSVVAQAINDTLPNQISISIPAVQVGGQTIGGDTITLDLPDNPVPTAQSGGFISGAGLAMLHEGERVVPASQVTDRGEVTVNGGGEVRVVVEGDTGVIKDVTAEMIQQQERQVKRKTGTNTNPTNR